MNKVLIAGGSGSVGRALKSFLVNKQYEVKVLTRQRDLSRKERDFLYWNPTNGEFELDGFNPSHVINLSGAGIADKKWSKNRKKIIIDSRVQSTTFLIGQLSKLNYPLNSFISASAIGYYGDTGQSMVTEDSKPLTDEFISTVCVLWEEAGHKAASISKSLSILRISTVLFKNGGALEKMDKTIPFGMANYLGTGKQYLSWIHMDDLCNMILHCMTNIPSGTHTFNAAATETINNYGFTKILRDVINPKALLLPAPSISLKLLLGEMSSIVLNSTLLSNQKIIDSGFTFKYPRLREALESLY